MGSLVNCDFFCWLRLGTEAFRKWANHRGLVSLSEANRLVFPCAKGSFTGQLAGPLGCRKKMPRQSTLCPGSIG